MVRYLQSRLNDLRDENLTLRERLKTSNYIQQTPSQTSNSSHQIQLNNTKTFSDNEFVNMNGSMCSGAFLNGQDRNNNIMGNSIADDDCPSASLYTPSIDGDDRLESRNELLQQKLDELQKLQIQLNNVQA